MTRNSLLTLVGVLVIVVAALIGYMIYQQQQQPGLEIKMDSNGLQVNSNG